MKQTVLTKGKTSLIPSTSYLQVWLMFFPFHNTAQKDSLCHSSASKTIPRDWECDTGTTDPIRINRPAGFLRKKKKEKEKINAPWSWPGRNGEGIPGEESWAERVQSRGISSASNKAVVSEPAHKDEEWGKETPPESGLDMLGGRGYSSQQWAWRHLFH